MSLERNIRVIETILASDQGQDIKILSEVIKMIGFHVKPIVVDGKTSRESFIESLTSGQERYIHVSAHGDSDGFYIHGERQTHVSVEHISQQVRVRYNNDRNCLRGRFLTASACGSPSLSFWKDFFDCTGVSAVVAPMGEVDFEESAMFYSAFYFALLRHPSSRIKQSTSQRLAAFIDTFQRTKGAYLSLGGNGAYRLCFRWEGDFKEVM
jgi:hypothetical protein